MTSFWWFVCFPHTYEHIILLQVLMCNVNEGSIPPISVHCCTMGAPLQGVAQFNSIRTLTVTTYGVGRNDVAPRGHLQPDAAGCLKVEVQFPCSANCCDTACVYRRRG